MGRWEWTVGCGLLPSRAATEAAQLPNLAHFTTPAYNAASRAHGVSGLPFARAGSSRHCILISTFDFLNFDFTHQSSHFIIWMKQS